MTRKDKLKPMPVIRPERSTVSNGFEISKIVTGLWQVADMEKSGTCLDLESSARAMIDYVADGFDTFDMADHYGSAELIAGQCLKLIREEPSLRGLSVPKVFTKWCPRPEEMTAPVVLAGVNERLKRLDSSCIDLLQFHWWRYENSGYLDALRELGKLQETGVISHIGVTNFNTDHLKVVLGQGINIATNQVSFSLLDRRAAGAMSELCTQQHVGILAYGTLCGGFLTDRWVGASEPRSGTITDWSKMKYSRFIAAFGGWQALQMLLRLLEDIARKHGVSVANVATRWVLEQPTVSAVIVGARLGQSQHRSDSLGLFSFKLDEEDYTRIENVLSDSDEISGDCGDEYRRSPFLTASGDLSHHLEIVDNVYSAESNNERAGREWVSTNTEWEAVGGFSRAVRVGDRILVSGTTATDSRGSIVCEGKAEEQTVFILDKILASIQALGGTEKDIIRTRIYLKNVDLWDVVSRVHGRYFKNQKPANTLVIVSDLVGNYEVEIEAEAIVCGEP